MFVGPKRAGPRASDSKSVTEDGASLEDRPILAELESQPTACLSPKGRGRGRPQAAKCRLRCVSERQNPPTSCDFRSMGRLIKGIGQHRHLGACGTAWPGACRRRPKDGPAELTIPGRRIVSEPPEGT